MKTIHPPSTLKPFLGSTALALVLWLTSPGATQAAYFRILDSSPDDSLLTIQVTDFQEGFLLNENVLQEGLGTVSTTLADSAGQLSFQGSWDIPADFPSGERTIYVLQQANGPVGAILHYSWYSEDNVGTILGTFQSDSAAQPDLGPLPGDAYEADVFVEGIPSISFSQPSLDAALVPESVPEPGSIGLLLAGALGAIGVRRRVKRS